MGVELREAQAALDSFLRDYSTGRRPEGDAIACVGYTKKGSGWELLVGLREVVEDPRRLSQEYQGTPIKYELRLGAQRLF